MSPEPSTWCSGATCWQLEAYLTLGEELPKPRAPVHEHRHYKHVTQTHRERDTTYLTHTNIYMHAKNYVRSCIQAYEFLSLRMQIHRHSTMPYTYVCTNYIPNKQVHTYTNVYTYILVLVESLALHGLFCKVNPPRYAQGRQKLQISPCTEESYLDHSPYLFPSIHSSLPP